ncbi:Synaptonemal complex protein 2-like [Larimichthys crocea]|nr:Synaptonemal complex protein 2-like [Larimichthys crocea]
MVTSRHVDVVFIGEVLIDGKCVKLLFQDLCGLGFSRVLVVLKSLEVLSENRDDLKMLVNHGLAVKAIRTFNSILESLSREQRRLIQNDQNQFQILSRMAAAVLTVGDYELQVSLSEALCRLTPRKDREQRANQWFSSHDISSAFCDIRDKDFEVLFPPKDDKLDQFWIDFNLNSGCGFLWGSVHLLKQEVDHYSVELKADGGSVQVSPSAANHSTRSYSRKKPQSKSHLKILPLSSPSSEEDSCVMKTSERKSESAESLFDHIRHSTPSYNSGVPEGAELQISQGEMGESGGSSSPLTKEVFGPDRKRDSGYLSDQTEGHPAHKRRAGPQPEGEEPDSPLTEGSPEEVEPPEEEEAGLCDEPVMEPKSDLTCGITAAFNTFKTELEQHFTGFFQAEMTRLGLFCEEHLQRLKSLESEASGTEHLSGQ